MGINDIDSLFREHKDDYNKMPSDSVWNRLDANLPNQQQLPAKVVYFSRYYYKYVAAAAMVLLMIGTAWFFIGEDPTNNPTIVNNNNNTVPAVNDVTAVATPKNNRHTVSNNAVDNSDSNKVINLTDGSSKKHANLPEDEVIPATNEENNMASASAEATEGQLAITTNKKPAKANYGIVGNTYTKPNSQESVANNTYTNKHKETGGRAATAGADAEFKYSRYVLPFASTDLDDVVTATTPASKFITLSDLAWLKGTWVAQSGEETVTLKESWHANGKTKWMATVQSYQNKKLVFAESVLLKNEHEQLYYQMKDLKTNELTSFVLNKTTSNTQLTFSSINKQSYVQTITYALDKEEDILTIKFLAASNKLINTLSLQKQQSN